MNVLLILCSIFECLKIVVGDIDTAIKDYFVSDTFEAFQKQWQIEKRSFENALVLILEQNYGVRGMNIYVRKMPDFYKISDGFYFSDNVVNVVLLKMYLQELPNLVAADVNFALASNFLRIETGIGKMIINTDYLLIRNQSEVTFSVPQEEWNKKSPFSFQQVQGTGELTIIAEDCTLVGYTITTLSGDSVNLGLDTFKIKNCKFRIEIYSAGSGSPPVMAQYFSKSQSEALETLLRKPIRTELMPKLQAAVFTYINTSAIFEDKLLEIRVIVVPFLRLILRSRQVWLRICDRRQVKPLCSMELVTDIQGRLMLSDNSLNISWNQLHQNKLFKEASNYVTIMVKNFVSNTIKDNHGIIQLNPFEVSWNKACTDGPCRTTIRLKDIILYGLDTVYSAHTGGPYKTNSVKVVESIRFSTMQVRGKLYFENATVKGEHDFAVELRDVEVNVEMEAGSGSLALVPTLLDFVGWRTMEFSIIEVDVFAHERRASESIITGYLINEIPKRLLDQLSQTFAVGTETNTQNFDKSDDDQSFNQSPHSDTSKEDVKPNTQEKNSNDEQSPHSDTSKEDVKPNTQETNSNDEQSPHSDTSKEDAKPNKQETNSNDEQSPHSDRSKEDVKPNTQETNSNDEQSPHSDTSKEDVKPNTQETNSNDEQSPHSDTSKEDVKPNTQETNANGEQTDTVNNKKQQLYIQEFDHYGHDSSSNDSDKSNNEKESSSNDSSNSENKSAIRSGIPHGEKKNVDDAKQQKMLHPSDNEVKK